MGFFVDFKKYPKTGWIKAREKRVADAQKRNEEAEESWENNPDLLKAQNLQEKEKIENLVKYGLSPPDPETDADFGQDFLDAESAIAKKLGDKNWNKIKEDKTENSEGFEFEGEILKVGDRVQLSESGADFDLSEQDKKGFKNLLKLLKKGKDIKKLMPMKMINLSAN